MVNKKSDVMFGISIVRTRKLRELYGRCAALSSESLRLSRGRSELAGVLARYRKKGEYIMNSNRTARRKDESCRRVLFELLEELRGL